jgi:hypothetical protein
MTIQEKNLGFDKPFKKELWKYYVKDSTAKLFAMVLGPSRFVFQT